MARFLCTRRIRVVLYIVLESLQEVDSASAVGILPSGLMVGGAREVVSYNWKL